jgi:flagellar biosynthesis/type III secretory pathway protein FliH
LLFNKKIRFGEAPVGFSVKHYGLPSVAAAQSDQSATDAMQKAKTEATEFYQKEIAQLRDELGGRQGKLLSDLNTKIDQVLTELEERLPDLVMGLVERVLPGIEFDRQTIVQIVRSMITEFTNDEEALEVYLCPDDLALLKALNAPDKPMPNNEEEGGFASAIAGIFDNLDGDNALLPEFPKVKFFEDSSLGRGDCQVKSRFGLLDGRISTKLRRVEEGLKGNG